MTKGCHVSTHPIGPTPTKRTPTRGPRRAWRCSHLRSRSVPSRSSASGATGLAVSRVSGADRYATAAAIADSGWPSALPANSTLLLATGSTFPDAVAGSAAAGHLGVPLLLTTSGSLSPQAAAEIDRLHPARVALLGGTAALECGGRATGRRAWADRCALARRRPIRHSGRDLAEHVSERCDQRLPRDRRDVPRRTRGRGAGCRRRRPAVVDERDDAAVGHGGRDHPAAPVGDRRARRLGRGERRGCQRGRAGGRRSDAVSLARRRPLRDRGRGGVGPRAGRRRDIGEPRRAARDRPRLPRCTRRSRVGRRERSAAVAGAADLRDAADVADDPRPRCRQCGRARRNERDLDRQLPTDSAAGDPPTSPPVPVVGGPTDWPTYHHDVARTGVAAATPGVHRPSPRRGRPSSMAPSTRNRWCSAAPSSRRPKAARCTACR